MHFTAAELVGAFDRIGMVAFALSGVEIGSRRQLDIFGLLVMGIVTATGGGLVRDLIIGRVPFVIERWDYLVWAAVASAVGIALVIAHRNIPRPIIDIADAAGLGAFTVAGALAGIHADLPVTAVIVLAVVTATGGGVVRDLLADRVPVVLRTEANATAAVLGGIVVWLVDPFWTGGAALLGLAVTLLVRVLSIAFDLHLPIPGHPRSGGQRRLL